RYRGELLLAGALQKDGGEVLVTTMDTVEDTDSDRAGTSRCNARELLTGESDGHERAAWTSARKFFSGEFGSIEHPGANKNRSPPVSIIARSASFTTSAGEPAVIVDSWETPPITARSVREAISPSDGLVGEWAAQWKAATG